MITDANVHPALLHGEHVIVPSDDFRHRGGPGVRQDFDRENFRVPRYSRNSKVVVPAGCNNAGYMRTVTVGVRNVPGIGNGIPSENVIDKSVPIVVQIVAGNLACVDKKIGNQVRMIDIYACI